MTLFLLLAVRDLSLFHKKYVPRSPLALSLSFFSSESILVGVTMCDHVATIYWRKTMILDQYLITENFVLAFQNVFIRFKKKPIIFDSPSALLLNFLFKKAFLIGK